MRAHQLVAVPRERQVAHLAPRVDAVDPVPRQAVPEPYAPVRRPTLARQQAVLVGAPRDRLHGRRVVRERVARPRVPLHVPHEELVVVPPRREHGPLVE